MADLTKKIEKLKRYEDFLKEVAIYSEENAGNPEKEDKENNGVQQLIKRYKNIKRHQATFAEQHSKIEKEKGEVIAEFTANIIKYQNEYILNNSEIPKRREQLDKLLHENHQLEDELDKREVENNSKDAKFGALIFAIKNLFFRAKTFKHVTAVPGVIWHYYILINLICRKKRVIRIIRS